MATNESKGKTVLGERLTELMEKYNMNKTELADLLGISRSMITLYGTGGRMPSYEILLKIADHFNVSIDWLTGRTDNPNLSLEKDETPLGRTVKIPVIGKTHPGKPVDALQNIEGYIEVPAEQVKGADYFFLKVKDDSMAGSKIYRGDIVFIRKQEQVESGEIAVIQLRNDITLRYVKNFSSNVILYANPLTGFMNDENGKMTLNYEPLILKRRHVKIIGKVIKVERYYEDEQDIQV